MTFYEQLVQETEMKNYARHYALYASGKTAVPLTKKTPLPYGAQIQDAIEKIQDADYVVVGGASGLSAAGGGDFYYEDNASFRKYFGKFAEKYHLNGAFSGTFRQWESREAFWGYMATFLHTTQHAPVRRPYVDLDAILKDKDFDVITTNQDTQFLRLYPESKVAELQGDHRFFQCSNGCTDDVWDAVEPVQKMIDAMGGGTEVPTELIPRCPHCGAEAFPWVRGYGNFLTGSKYEAEYQKATDFVIKNTEKKILFLELGVGRITPMFIQEPFWELTHILPKASYISVNRDYAFLPENIEDRGIAIQGDIAKVLTDIRTGMGK
ncbi:MAG: NAD-dependent protein deacetylase [Pseudoramibacter sp.]